MAIGNQDNVDRARVIRHVARSLVNVQMKKIEQQQQQQDGKIETVQECKSCRVKTFTLEIPERWMQHESDGKKT